MATVDKVQAAAAADVVRVNQGAAAQTGDLQQFQSSAGAVLSRVTAAGEFIGPGGTAPPDAALVHMNESHGAPKTGPTKPQQSTLGDPGATGSDQAPAKIDHVHDRNNDAALYWMAVKP